MLKYNPVQTIGELQMAQDYNFPVYGTQGGGLAREVNGKFIFVEAPPGNFTNLTVGSEVPEEWSMVPANESARRSLDHEDLNDSEASLAFVFEEVLNGKMTVDDALRYVPQHMHGEVRTVLEQT